MSENKNITQVSIKDIKFCTADTPGELDALKALLGIMIFTAPCDYSLSVMKSMSETDNPNIQKLFKELMQFNPNNWEI